jgi:beta-lactamase class A
MKISIALAAMLFCCTAAMAQNASTQTVAAQPPAQPPMPVVTLPSPLPATLAELVPAITAKVSTANVEFAIADLADPQHPVFAGFNETIPIYPASVIKVPILVAAYTKAENDPAFLEQVVTIEHKNFTETWDPLAENGIHDPDPAIREGDKLKVSFLLHVMISRSDNIATNTMIDLLGRPNINALMEKLGYEKTRVYRKVYGETPLDDPEEAHWSDRSNIFPPGEAVRMLAEIYAGKIASPASCKAMMSPLLNQLDRELVAAVLPKDAVYAGKTGETSKVLHDIDIVTGPHRRYALAVYTNHHDRPARVIDIHMVGAMVDAYFTAQYEK